MHIFARDVKNYATLDLNDSGLDAASQVTLDSCSISGLTAEISIEVYSLFTFVNSGQITKDFDKLVAKCGQKI